MRRDESVTLAYVHPNQISHSFHHSIVSLIGYELGREPHVLAGGWLAMKCGTEGLVDARNKTVKEFLENKDADWLLWVDTDMGFEPDAVERLLEVADAEERPIVGGLCFTWRERAADGMGGYRAQATVTIFDWLMSDPGGTGTMKGFIARTTYPVNTLVQCAGTGSAFILIHRDVFIKILNEFGPIWYDRIPNSTTGQQIGEDLSFCMRAQALKLPVFVHTGIRTNHEKHFWLAEPDFWNRAIAPPATVPTAVIVPTKGRPQAAERFMQSLRASTGLATAYAVINKDDPSAEAWRKAGATVLSVDVEGWAVKCNEGYKLTTEPWLFFVGDDVRFYPAWLDHAQAVAGDRYHVIGTNDLGNPRVMRGEHAVHWLVRRSYIDEQGASWDGPGTVLHDGYYDWYSDDEMVTVARQREAFAMALGSIVEHLHPAWGKGEPDETYSINDAHVEADRKIWKARQRQFIPNRRERRQAEQETKTIAEQVGAAGV